MKFKFLILSLVVISMFSLPFTVEAVSPSSINIDILPSNPAPLEATTITLSSYASNLDSVTISWFVSGKKMSSGVGIKSFTTKAPNAGAEIIVRAVIELPDGTIEKNVIIRPNVLTLLWQATQSHVPPFYRGKALPTADSEIKIIAMPEIKNGSNIVNPKNLVYSWKKNYLNETESSGYAKNYFSYINDYLEDVENISVDVSTTDGKYSTQANINVTLSEPQISFYKNDPLFGVIWDQALKNGYKINKEETIVAEPYFISPKETWSPNLTWSWYLNDTPIENTSVLKNWLPLKVQGDDSGSSNLKLEIENKQQLLGTVNKEINLEF